MHQHVYVKPEAILKKLKLAMPLAITLEDPITHQPIAIAYENLHSLLVVDVQHLALEGQVIASLYAEMSRFQRAAEYEASRSEGRYRQWKAQMAEECADKTPEKKTAKGARAAKQGPTASEIETYYRNHADYEKYAYAGERMKAIAGFFGDLARAFHMKSRVISDQSRIITGFESTASAETSTERLSDYQNTREEAFRIVAESGSSEAMADILREAGFGQQQPQEPKRKKAPVRAVEEDEDE